jgi:hypothetical protein
VFVSDALTLDAPRRTADGYLAVRAKAARVGHYEYSGRDVDPDNAHGLRDAATVHVARDADTVFDSASVRSFIGKPITDDHPIEAVTAGNWRDHSRGVVMGAIRDGDHLAFDLVLMDAATIAKVEGGKVELSNGYSAGLEFGDFTAADGTKCQARQTSITGNHVAIVDRGRAGPSCRIGDAATCSTAPSTILDSLKQEKPVSRTLTIDGLPVNVADADAATATINRLVEQRDGLKTRAETAEGLVTARDATIVQRDATIVTLTSDKAALEAAKPTPAQLRDAAKAYGIVVAKGKAAGITVTDAMGEDEIKKAVVDKAMPGNTYSAEHIAIAFDALTKDAKVDDAAGRIHSIGTPVIVGDAATDYATARAKRKTDLTDAWRKPFNAADAA